MAEVNSEKLHIRLHVYDEEIEVTIPRADEEYYRKAAKLITDRYNAYAQATHRLIRGGRASILSR